MGSKRRALSTGIFAAVVIAFVSAFCGSLFVLARANSEAQKRLVVDSYLDLERAIVERTVAMAELWFYSRMDEASISQVEQEVFSYFVDPIRVLRSGDAWIYNRDYVIYDASSDFPMKYRARPIDEIFRMQAELGASHYESLVKGVLEAGEGEDWYIWLPSKGREWAVWKSFGFGGSTWTLGLSTPENEIYEYYGVDDFARSGYAYCCVVSLCCMICGGLFIGWYRRKQALTEALTAAKIEAEEASGAKGDFLAAMSHEIRTPMNSILGFLELMSLGPLDAEQREYLSIIVSNAQNLLSIINDILDFSKIEKGKMEFDAVPFDPVETAGHVVKLFEKKAAEKNLRLEFGYAATSPACLGDPLRLSQVLINLIGNAIKFTPEGGRVELGLSSAAEGGLVRLNVEVTDTGIGIPGDRLESIFDAFTQSDPSISRRFGGTGLGLSISSRIVKLMGGSLSVESELGKGSRFYFSVALPAADSQAARKREERSLGEVASVPLHALVAEDTPDSRKLLEHMLERLGATADAAEDGERALALFKRGRYDAVILDGYMPRMGGVEAAKAMREFEAAAGLPRTPIIALSAKALASEKGEFLAAGADLFLSKPVSLAALSEALRAISERGKAPARAEEDHALAAAGRRFDEAVLLGRLEGDADFMRELLGIFVDEAPRRRAAFAAAIEARDLQALRDAAHALKGSSMTLCAKSLAAVAAALESACVGAVKAADPRLAYPSLEAQVAAVLAILDESVEEARRIL